MTAVPSPTRPFSMSSTTMRGQQTGSTSSAHVSTYGSASIARRVQHTDEEVAIGAVYHLGGQWRAAIRVDDDLILVAKSRGEGFYVARDARLVASFKPDPLLAEEMRDVQRRRPRRLTLGR